MINGVTMKILADDYILRALQEDVTSEDVTTNAVMPMPKQMCIRDNLKCCLML